MMETLLEQLARESFERERKKRQASQGQPSSSVARSRKPQKAGVVALYALTMDGDESSLILARHVCQQKGWLEPFEYIDSHIPRDHEPSMYRHCIADVSEGLIKVLVTYHTSPELEAYCQQFGCKIMEAKV